MTPSFRDPYVIAGVAIIVVIVALYLATRGTRSVTKESIVYEQLPPSKGELNVEELFTNQWVCKMNAKECKEKWGMEVPEITVISFSKPTEAEVNMKMESTSSKGDNRVKYTVKGNSITFYDPQGEGLFVITGNHTFRHLGVEKEVTDGERFECTLTRKSKVA